LSLRFLFSCNPACVEVTSPCCRSLTIKKQVGTSYLRESNPLRNVERKVGEAEHFRRYPMGEERREEGGG